MGLKKRGWSNCLLATIVLGLLGWSPTAGALQQVNNQVIPTGPNLQALFDGLMDPLSALADAKTTPETFYPACEVSFKVLLRNAGYKNAFGWYNVTNNAPTLADLHQILSCNDPVDTVKKVSITADPAYLGGQVGFFQAVGNCADLNNPNSVNYIFYSQPKWNPDADNQNPYIHLIVYDSKSVPRTYYFAWEDLIQGGDNDFDDLTTSVSGVVCNGQPCQPFNDALDLDHDGFCNPDGYITNDNCDDIANPDQKNSDNDPLGDACDNCPDDDNIDQNDNDNDGIGDACDPFDDSDMTTSTTADASTGDMSGDTTAGDTGDATDASTGNLSSVGETAGESTSGGSQSSDTEPNTSVDSTDGGEGNSASNSDSGNTASDSDPTADTVTGTGVGEGGEGDGESASGGAPTTGGGGNDTVTGSGDGSGTAGEIVTPEGCSCTSTPQGPGALLSLALAGLAVRRRRR